MTGEQHRMVLTFKLRLKVPGPPPARLLGLTRGQAGALIKALGAQRAARAGPCTEAWLEAQIDAAVERVPPPEVEEQRRREAEERERAEREERERVERVRLAWERAGMDVDEEDPDDPDDRDYAPPIAGPAHLDWYEANRRIFDVTDEELAGVFQAE